MNKYISAMVFIFYALNGLAQDNPETVATQFYDWRIQTPSSGVPEKSELNIAQAYLSTPLICLLHRGHDYRDLFIKTFPGDKPPFIEGDLFTSSFEGANRYTLVSIDKSTTAATVTIQFFYDQAEHLDKTGWRDTVLLKRKNRQWRITDIRYGGHFEFGNHGSLRQNLIRELAQKNTELGWRGKSELRACRLSK